jgi:hypothetical protein
MDGSKKKRASDRVSVCGYLFNEKSSITTRRHVLKLLEYITYPLKSEKENKFQLEFL